MPKCKSNIYCNSARCSDYDVPYSEMPCLFSPHKHGISNLPTSATEVVNTLVVSKEDVSPNTTKFTPLIYVILTSKKKFKASYAIRFPLIINHFRHECLSFKSFRTDPTKEDATEAQDKRTKRLEPGNGTKCRTTVGHEDGWKQV